MVPAALLPVGFEKAAGDCLQPRPGIMVFGHHRAQHLGGFLHLCGRCDASSQKAVEFGDGFFLIGLRQRLIGSGNASLGLLPGRLQSAALGLQRIKRDKRLIDIILGRLAQHLLIAGAVMIVLRNPDLLIERSALRGIIRRRKFLFVRHVQTPFVDRRRRR